MTRGILFSTICLAATFCSAAQFPLRAVRSIDGSGNAEGGAVGDPLVRSAPANYPGDGSGEEMKQPPLAPNPRTVSNTVVAQRRLKANARNLSDMVWAWGQFLDHDIDLTEASADNGTADIAIEDPDDVLGPLPIPFDRSHYYPGTGDAEYPREQVNGITAFIDASNVYGSDEVRAAALRRFSKGRLKTSRGNLLPRNVDGLPNAGGPDAELFLAGDVRANEQVGLTAMHTLFVREHNRLARRIARRYRGASDEQIYQLARKIVGAEMQIITYEEFLPALLGPMAPQLEDYGGWDRSVNPAISNEFSTAAYRFGHSMLSPVLLLADQKGPFDGIALRDAFFHPELLTNKPANVEYLLHGFTYQRAQEVDNLLVDDVRNFLFGPPGAGGIDLASMNIQRGRDHGLPSYNVVRAAYGLAPANNFEDISSRRRVQTALAAVYDSPDDVDAWVGGLAEDHVSGASVGQLVGTILAHQFVRLRDGDRFFLNDPTLSPKRIRPIINFQQVTLAKVIQYNTRLRRLPKNVFFVKKGR